jgi:hypothetical protein
MDPRHPLPRAPTETAQQAWLTIEAQFLSNSELHVLQLDAKFRAFKQGMADDLRALGEIVTDRHLVLNFLHGLNKRFNHMKIFIKQSQSFPSFHTICNDLELEEIELDHSAAQGHASAFYSVPSEGGHPPQQQLPPRPSPQETPCPQAAPPSPAPTPTTAAKARGRGKARTTTPATTAEVPRLGPPNPWTGTISTSAAADDTSTAARPTCCTSIIRGSR